jgi:serine/threonine protein phosphatase PrpC
MSVDLRCPACAAFVDTDDLFCEQCGNPLRIPSKPGPDPFGRPVSNASDPHRSHPGPGRDAEQSDDTEMDLGQAAAVTNRGNIHPRNEDAVWIGGGDGRLAAVVCDGVSSTAQADRAAAAAVRAAGTLLNMPSQDADRGSETSTTRHLENATRAAIDASLQAVADLAPSQVDADQTPSCTYVSAVIEDGRIAVGWVGDSRAYWIGRTGAHRITTDDSWAGQQVTSGLMSADVAEADPRAHTITRWLGADAPAAEPHIVGLEPACDGLVVLCTDGLWNYVSAANELAAHIQELSPAHVPIDVARGLCRVALDAGGADNVTVAVLGVSTPDRIIGC